MSDNLHASRASAVGRHAIDIVRAFGSVPMEFDGSYEAWGYDGGRDLSTVESDVHAIERGNP